MATDQRLTGVERLFGVTGARAIQNSHVAVVGLGGVGSWATESLARSGVGTLTLIDFDHVAPSNINRQIQAIDATVGQAKVLAMRDRILTFYPQCKINCIQDFVHEDNWPTMLPNGVDALIDACDHIKAKVVMAQWARNNPECFFIMAGAAGGKRLAHEVSIADLADVTHDPVLSKVRYQLRKNHAPLRQLKKMGVCCVFSPEPIAMSNASSALMSDSAWNNHSYGSSVTVTATSGHCAAGFILNQVAKSARVQAKVSDS
jgi:tRNA A37 threonylcarbamoyladenosine dehydratase